MQLRASFAVLLGALLASIAVAPLCGQRTWIVDWRGGPGVDFTLIEAAYNASQPGDTILIRPGVYSSLAGSLDYPVSFVAEVPDTVEILRSFGVTNFFLGGERLPMVFSGLRVVHASTITAIWGLARPLANPIVFDRCRFVRTFAEPGYHISIRNCVDVTFRDCEFTTPQGPFEIKDSHVRFLDCHLAAGGYGSSRPGPRVLPTEALFLENSTVELIRTRVLGADARVDLGNPCVPLEPPTSAVRILNSTLIVGDGSHVAGGAGSTVPGCPPCQHAAPPIVGTGTVHLDPTVRLDCPQPQAGIAEIPEVIHSVVAGPLQRGATFSLRARSEPGALLLLLANAPAPPWQSPWGPVWLDPATALVLGLATVPGTGVVTTSYGVPASLRPGMTFTFQAGVLLPSCDLVASVAAVSTTTW